MLYQTILLDLPKQTPCQNSKNITKLYLCGPQTLWLFWQVAIHCCLVDQLDELFAFQRQFADISNTCQKAMEIHPVHLTPLCCKCLCSILQRHLEKSGVEICSVIVQLFESLINRYNIYIYISISCNCCQRFEPVTDAFCLLCGPGLTPSLAP